MPSDPYQMLAGVLDTHQILRENTNHFGKFPNDKLFFPIISKFDGNPEKFTVRFSHIGHMNYLIMIMGSKSS